MHRLHGRLRRLEAQANQEESPDGPGLAVLLTWASRHPQAEHEAWEEGEAAAPRA